MASRQIARIAETKAGAEAYLRSPCAQIACATWSPPATALSQGDCHMRTRSASVARRQPVAHVKAGREQNQSGDRHAHAAARDGIDRQKDAAEEERGSEILLKEEEHQGRADADEDGKNVFDARQVDPRRQPDIANASLRTLPQQLPSTREVSGEEQREEQADGFNRLDRSEIDLRRAAAGPAAEENQERGQRQRRHQWQVAERDECRIAAKSTSESAAISPRPSAIVSV